LNVETKDGKFKIAKRCNFCRKKRTYKEKLSVKTKILEMDGRTISVKGGNHITVWNTIVLRKCGKTIARKPRTNIVYRVEKPPVWKA